VAAGASAAGASAAGASAAGASAGAAGWHAVSSMVAIIKTRNSLYSVFILHYSFTKCVAKLFSFSVFEFPSIYYITPPSQIFGLALGLPLSRY
jgi:hypothetical protein